MFKVVIVLLVTLATVAAFGGGAIRATTARSFLDMKKVLIVGGTRFSGLYLWKELFDRGHEITLYNRGKYALKKVPKETEADFEKRKAAARFIKGDRQVAAELQEKLGNEKFDVIYDMNGREASDTAPLADIFNGKCEHFVYMSSAGVYKKSLLMPHIEGDEEDVKSRHKGKLETESYLKKIGIPFTSIRPTYIYGAGNYNPLEEWFFTRLDQDMTICIPGHGQHLTGLGHVEDLAVAMANVIGKDVAKGKIYNIQDENSATFEGLAKLCATAMGKNSPPTIKFYKAKSFDFGDKKAFPMREQHFFCDVKQAMKDLDWKPKFNMADGLKDAYNNDFVLKKAAGKLNLDFTTDEMILANKVTLGANEV